MFARIEEKQRKKEDILNEFKKNEILIDLFIFGFLFVFSVFIIPNALSLVCFLGILELWFWSFFDLSYIYAFSFVGLLKIYEEKNG